MLLFVQILGNELPPRDLPGERIASLENLLKVHSPPKDKFSFLLNRIACEKYEQSLISLLMTWGYNYRVIPYQPDLRLLQSHNVDPVRYAKAVIRINEARNNVIKFGLENAQYVCPLDQDCSVSEDHYEKIRSEILKYERESSKPYYSLAMRRGYVSSDKVEIGKRNEEPQVIFTKNSNEWFDESLGFSENDKRSFLCKIGYSKADSYTLSGPYCSEVGVVVHISKMFNPSDVDLRRRVATRRQSLLKFGEERIHADKT